MNRSTRRAAAAVLLAGGLGATGCTGVGASARAEHDGALGGTYRHFIDPCWPDRYNAAARSEVLSAFAPQVNNGHVLNQTVWNWYFEPGTATLTPAGLAKLDSIAQTRPAPDARLYLQVARDVSAVVGGGIDTIAARRDDLTAKRAESVQKYMAAQPAISPVAYELSVIDPVVTGIRGDFATNAYRGQGSGYRGGIGGGSGVAATSTGGGGTPAASAIGGGAPAAGGGGGGPGYVPSGPGGGSGGGSAPGGSVPGMP